MSRNPRLESLVRDTLGCTCPEEVFREIDELPPTPDSPVTRSWVIGDRLMIQILRTDDARALATRLPARRERDRRGLNRVRLVIASDDPTAAGLEVIPLPDDRIHLHVLPRAALAGLGG
jgi:hypothetical protein